MAKTEQFDYNKLPKHRVELHVHLDGSVRISTLWDLANKKGIKLPAKTVEELYENVCIKCPSTLESFLKPFSTCILPVIMDDPDAIERIAFEFCEDLARQKVLYCEVRYCPHLLIAGCGTSANPTEKNTLTARDVVMCVNKGLSRGCSTFQITVRSILCCIRGRSEWAEEILNLCVEFKQQGVVGIDIAGDEESEEFENSTDIAVFKRAYELGIHRTVHAGEAGPASDVKIAVDKMFAERIGHGYHVVDDDDIYRHVKEKGIHFEVCPYSSCLTGSIPPECLKHPAIRFAEDNVSFSINRDDPTLIQKTLDEEYAYLQSLGMKDIHFAKANFNAAMHSFLPADEKACLLKQLKEIYGVPPDAAS